MPNCAARSPVKPHFSTSLVHGRSTLTIWVRGSVSQHRQRWESQTGAGKGETKSIRTNVCCCSGDMAPLTVIRVPSNDKAAKKQYADKTLLQQQQQQHQHQHQHRQQHQQQQQHHQQNARRDKRRPNKARPSDNVVVAVACVALVSS